MSLLVGVAAFGAGVWLLVESVEGLVKTVRAWALAAGLSGIVLSALVLGADVEATAAGVAATLRDLPGTALGTSIGASIFLLTIGLGLAGLVAPFSIPVPRPLLVSAAVGAALAAGACADGRLSRVDGAVLLAAFALMAAFVLSRRHADSRPAGAGGRPPRLAVRLLVGLAGILIGAELLVFGTERTVSELELSETVFGLLVVAAAVSLEELVIEALPAYRGFPELSVGNALGTVAFLLSGSLGVIALVRPLDVPDSVLEYHLPALGMSLLLAGGLLLRGRLGRPEGALLCAAYAVYVAGALLA